MILWASLNWLLDAASLWVFLRAFGGTLEIDALLIAFGLANIFAVIPITPGGLGIVEGIYIPTLVGFGLRRRVATLGVASYRLAQYWLPILLGGVLLPVAARRAVVDRAARPPRPAARHRPAGDGRERAAHRVRDAPVGAQAAGVPRSRTTRSIAVLPFDVDTGRWRPRRRGRAGAGRPGRTTAVRPPRVASPSDRTLRPGQGAAGHSSTW